MSSRGPPVSPLPAGVTDSIDAFSSDMSTGNPDQVLMLVQLSQFSSSVVNNFLMKLKLATQKGCVYNLAC